MKDILTEIITEFHETPLPIPIKRDISLPEFPLGVRKALVFIGMRRSGKTYTLYQIMHELIEQGVDLKKMLYINFEDDRLAGMKISDFQDILKAYFEKYPEYVGRDDIHFFFDEIHEVTGWQKFIRRLLDQEKAHIYVTGSSCKLLSKEIATNLRGRTWTLEIFPYSFGEYLRALGIVPRSIRGKSNMVLMHHLQNFLKYGGFPESVNQTAEIHRGLLQGYLDTVIYRDIIERYGITNIHSLKFLLTHCLRNSATVFSINKIYNTFKSLGKEVGKNSLYEFMDYFEDAYCVFSLEKFDLSQRKSAIGMKKIFAIDQGLITAETMSSSFDLAAQLETAVFAHLRRQSPGVFCYRTQDNKEVDFVLLRADQTMSLYQVCLSMKEPSTRRREIEALDIAMRELKLNAGVIVTLDEQGEIKVESGTITMVPAIKMFLAGEID